MPVAHVEIQVLRSSFIRVWKLTKRSNQPTITSHLNRAFCFILRTQFGRKLFLPIFLSKVKQQTNNGVEVEIQGFSFIILFFLQSNSLRYLFWSLIFPGFAWIPTSWCLLDQLLMIVTRFIPGIQYTFNLHWLKTPNFAIIKTSCWDLAHGFLCFHMIFMSL